MTIDFTKPVLFDAANNGYMVTLENGLPYEVLTGDPLRASILTWMNGQGNMVQPYVPPTPVPLTIQQQLAALDAVVSRDVEDWYAESGKTPAYGPRADAIAKKQALRAKLKGPASGV